MFHINLKKQRLKCGLSQKQIADYLMCDQSLYSKYERGERPMPLEYAAALADFYGVSVKQEIEHKKVCTLDTITFLSLYQKYKDNKESIDLKDIILNCLSVIHKNIIDFISNDELI